MSLTVHFDASDTEHIWNVTQTSGVHTGTPTDGSVVQAWDDEGDGILTDVIMQTGSGGSIWSSVLPLMRNPCLVFDGVNDTYESTVQGGNTLGFRLLSSLITAAASTVIIAFRATSITTTLTSYQGQCLIGDNTGNWGVFLRNSSGQRKIAVYNYDGTEDYFETNINENTDYVFMFRHASGNLYMSINGAAEVGPTASGNTASLTATLKLGVTAYSQLYAGRIGEFKIWNTGNADGNLAAEIAAMMSKWITPAGTSTPVSLSASLTLAGTIAKRLNKPFAGVI